MRKLHPNHHPEKVGLSLQKKTVHASERERPDVVAKREAWGDTIHEIPLEKLVFLDESGVNTNMSRRYAWSFAGSRAVDAVPLNKGQSTTILSSVRLNGATAKSVFAGAVNRDKFKSYLRDCLAPSLRPGDVVIMDNLPCHKVDGVKDIIEHAGASILYLPPYSPDLNPIEMMWSKIKAFLRMRKARSLDSLLAAIPDAFSSVSVSDIIGWFSAAGYSA